MKTLVRRTRRMATASGFWKPSNVAFMLSSRSNRRESRRASDDERIREAGAWLGRGQDANGDGGVPYAYRLHGGWGASYPETTGYIVPTFLALAEVTGDLQYRERAERGIAFLMALQLPEGAFPGGTLAEAERNPSVFNSGQIINGLTAWYRSTGDERVRAAACRAGDWLASVQDDDGAWRRHGYLAYPVTYTAHVACWLAELGVLLDEARFRTAASRHMDWVMGQQDRDSGWFDRAGFEAADHERRVSITHTVAYTIWGLLHGGVVLDRADTVASARRAADRLADLALERGWLPGMVDAAFQPASTWACLTGNAQMALVWMRLADLAPDRRLERATTIALDRVCVAQSLSASDPGIRGGVPGSDPIFGGYFPFELPNWGAKFYVDALIARRARADRTMPA